MLFQHKTWIYFSIVSGVISRDESQNAHTQNMNVWCYTLFLNRGWFESRWKGVDKASHELPHSRANKVQDASAQWTTAAKVLYANGCLTNLEQVHLVLHSGLLYIPQNVVYRVFQYIHENAQNRQHHEAVASSFPYDIWSLDSKRSSVEKCSAWTIPAVLLPFLGLFRKLPRYITSIELTTLASGHHTAFTKFHLDLYMFLNDKARENQDENDTYIFIPYY